MREMGQNSNIPGPVVVSHSRGRQYAQNNILLLSGEAK